VRVNRLDERASELKSATDAVLLIRQRNERAWPIALMLATMWRNRCVKRLLDAEEYRSHTPVLATEADLEEVFGKPPVWRGLLLERGGKAPQGHGLLRRMAKGAE
jgi:hypothetical protein